jgi:hypothetical protein
LDNNEVGSHSECFIGLCVKCLVNLNGQSSILGNFDKPNSLITTKKIFLGYTNAIIIDRAYQSSRHNIPQLPRLHIRDQDNMPILKEENDRCL